MPRPIRIEYENAYFHVMNRGRGHRTIFYSSEYYQAYLHTLEEAHRRFDAIFHAYCLMGNHYHLLVQTPRANLSRIMRHINGVYTQRHNRLKNTDGPLFRGRYKSILVDANEYFLQLSRYIHRNPIEIQTPIKQNLENYRWSSYPAYLGASKAPDWLSLNTTLDMVGSDNPSTNYENFVNEGNNKNFLKFYTDEKWLPIMGSKEFKRDIIHKNINKITDKRNIILSSRPEIHEIISIVANHFNVRQTSITKRATSRPKKNFPRRFAMYCCQYYGDISRNEIASAFNVRHAGSVSNAIHEIKNRIHNRELCETIDEIEKKLLVTKLT